MANEQDGYERSNSTRHVRYIRHNARGEFTIVDDTGQPQPISTRTTPCVANADAEVRNERLLTN